MGPNAKCAEKRYSLAVVFFPFTLCILSCSFFFPFTLCSLWSFLVAKFNNRVCFAKRQMSSLHLIVLRVMKHFHPTWKVLSTFNCFACNQTFPFNVESPNFISSELKKGMNFKI